MNDFRRFILRAACVMVLVAGAAIGLFLAIKPDPQHYYQSSLLKLELLRNTPSPRIILAGGSNVAWGIDSEMIEREMGIPAINTGLDAHLGITPITELKDFIQPGDIIILSLEYYNFASRNDFYGVSQNIADWLEVKPSRVKYLENPMGEAPGLFTTALQRKLNRELNIWLYDGSLSEFRGLYSAENFNDHGDFIGHLKPENAATYDFADTQYPVNQLDEAYDYLENFYQFAHRINALVFFEAQPHRQNNCNLTGVKHIKAFYGKLKARNSFRLLTDLNNLCLPDDYFYDTPYHLNAIGREVRTKRLIENLKKAIGESQ